MKDDWLTENDYPDDDDIEAFGYDSEPDYSPLTIGYIGDERPSFWTANRVALVIGIGVLVVALLLPMLLR